MSRWPAEKIGTKLLPKGVSKKKISSTDVEDAIIQSVSSRRPDFNREELERLAEEFSHKFETIMEYEEAPFLNVMVEMRNPFAVSIHLRSLSVYRNGKEVPLYSESQIQEILKKNFGENWGESYLKKYVGQAIPPEKPK